jgi:hypothetical protein
MAATRRTFIRVFASGGVALALGGWGWRHAPLFGRAAARLTALVRSPEERLRTHFSYLDLDPNGLHQFVADYERHRHSLTGRPIGPDISMCYLMSTDFFRHGADESRRIHYVGFFDPYLTPCHNPLVPVE